MLAPLASGAFSFPADWTCIPESPPRAFLVTPLSGAVEKNCTCPFVNTSTRIGARRKCREKFGAPSTSRTQFRGGPQRAFDSISKSVPLIGDFLIGFSQLGLRNGALLGLFSKLSAKRDLLLRCQL